MSGAGTGTSHTEQPNTKQLFVLGAPRSGTTFLASLLEGTRFGTPVESQFIVKYYNQLASYDDLNSRSGVNRLIVDILKERAVMQWKLQLDTDAIHAKLEGMSGVEAYACLIEMLFLARPEAEGREAWGDKTPHYLGQLDIIDTLFPNARYLVIVRDGRDVAMSLLRMPWGPNNVHSCAEGWSDLNADVEKMRQLEAQGRVLRLRYEDLVTDVDNHLRLIADFLGEQLLDCEIERLANTVSTKSVGKWRKAMSPRQLRVFEAEAGETLRRLDYPTSSTRTSISSMERVVYKAHDKLVWAKFMFSTNVIDGFKIRFLNKEPFAE